jgi:NAD(P)-dependent dehydrogenase (short-subunit alcohol dehydrogenase family)
MIRERRGKIINLSGGSPSPLPNFSAYAASKAAIVRLTETLAQEVEEYNIQVNAIAPGAVNTALTDALLAAGPAAGEEMLAQARRQKEDGGVPPERAAALAVFLASEASDGLSGRLISAVWDDGSMNGPSNDHGLEPVYPAPGGGGSDEVGTLGRLQAGAGPRR